MMRESHFWKLRDWMFGVASRIRPRRDPLPAADPLVLSARDLSNGDAYQLLRWRERLSDADITLFRSLANALHGLPRIGLIVLGCEPGAEIAATTIASMRDQIYPAHDIAFSGGVPLSADCTFVGMISQGDILERDALFHIACAVAGGAEFVYTDEDVVASDGVPKAPTFKPDWSPETQLTRNMCGSLTVFRRDFCDDARLAIAEDAAAWYDLALYASERTKKIIHLPRVLLHRDVNRQADFDTERGAQAARDALRRRGEVATVVAASPGWDVRFSMADHDRATIVIPTRDQAALLERCLSSIFERTVEAAFDVVVVDNGSVEDATYELFEHWRTREPDRFRTIADPEPFNFSRLVNAGVAATAAPHAVLLNNDTEVIAPLWLARLIGQSRRTEIGAVGALLLYEDGTVQHAGVVLGGVLALAGHAFRGMNPDAANAPAALRLDTNWLAVTGACLAIEREKYFQVGGFDEAFSVAFNDVDFCLKLHAAGYRNVVVPAARLYHHESKSRGFDDTREKVARGQREADLLRARYPEWSRRDPYYNQNLTLDDENFGIRRR